MTIGLLISCDVGSLAATIPQQITILGVSLVLPATSWYSLCVVVSCLPQSWQFSCTMVEMQNNSLGKSTLIMEIELF